MPMTSKEMLHFLKKNGFKTVSQNGSHNHSKELKKGMEQAILKQAGLKYNL